MNTNYNSACDEYDLKNYTKAFELFYQLALDGDSDSQANIANMLLHGLGTDVDEDTAYYWYKKSAENNDKKSQCWYGLHLQEKKQYEEAFEWFCKSALQNYPPAQYYYGKYLFLGLGCTMTKKEALKNIILSANNDNIDALVFLTHKCLHGKCGILNFFRAFKWFYKTFKHVRNHSEKQIY